MKHKIFFKGSSNKKPKTVDADFVIFDNEDNNTLYFTIFCSEDGTPVLYVNSTSIEYIEVINDPGN